MTTTCNHCNKLLFHSDAIQDTDGNRYHIDCFAELIVQGIFGLEIERCDKSRAVRDMIEAELMDEALARPYRRYSTVNDALNA